MDSGSFWRRGHAQMVAAEEAGRYSTQSVYAHALGAGCLRVARLCGMAGSGFN